MEETSSVQEPDDPRIDLSPETAGSPETDHSLETVSKETGACQETGLPIDMNQRDTTPETRPPRGQSPTREDRFRTADMCLTRDRTETGPETEASPPAEATATDNRASLQDAETNQTDSSLLGDSPEGTTPLNRDSETGALRQGRATLR